MKIANSMRDITVDHKLTVLCKYHSFLIFFSVHNHIATYFAVCKSLRTPHILYENLCTTLTQIIGPCVNKSDNSSPNIQESSPHIHTHVYKFQLNIETQMHVSKYGP